MDVELHPIIPGLWCAPTAIYALTGADPVSVIHPALHRHHGNGPLLEIVTEAHRNATIATIRELGYTLRAYKGDEKLTAQVRTWAVRSLTKYPGRALLIFIHKHVLVMKNGRVYDNWMPHGPLGVDHSFAKTQVEEVFLVERRER